MNKLLYLVFVKSKLNIKSETTQNRLSYGWLLIEPLIFMSVYYVVFGVFLKKGTEDFVVYLMSGLVPWLWFQRAVSRSSLSIVKGKGLASQVSLSNTFFVLVVCIQESYKQIISFLLLFAMLFLFGFYPSLNWAWLLIVVTTQFILVISFSLLLAFVTTFFRDVNMLIPSGMRVLMYISGIVYPIARIPQEYQWVFYYNPIANLIGLYRDILIGGSSPNIDALLYLSVFSIVLLFFMMSLFRKYNEKLTREIMR